MRKRKVALIIGASGGLGLELAKLLAPKKYDLVVVARSEGKLQKLKEELEDKDTAVYVCPVDLSVPDAALKVFDFTQEHDLKIDVLINNAGFGDSGAFAQADWKKQYEMVQVNITALMQLTHCFLPGMMERKSGKILNLSSVAAFCAGPGMSIYYASKAFVRSFSEAVEEIKGTGVTVTALCPGPTATGFEASAAMGKDSRMFKKATKAEDVAKAGLRAMRKKKVLCYQGGFTKLMSFLCRIVPDPLQGSTPKRRTKPDGESLKAQQPVKTAEGNEYMSPSAFSGVDQKMKQEKEALTSYLRRMFSLREDAASHEEIRDRLLDGGKITGTNMCVLICAMIIASVGLNTGSTAVIIGAMLISPLMGSILAMAYGTVSNDGQLAGRHAVGLLIQIGISLIASTLYFAFSPVRRPTSELLARTSPTFFDAIIAIAGGTAGIIGQTRKDKANNIIPGVAIATAPMPPICTCGYSIANGRWMMLGKAAYLFVLNAYFIFLSANMVLSILQIPKAREMTANEWKKLRKRMIRNTLIVVVPSVLFLLQMVQ